MLNKKMMPSPNLPEANVFGAKYNGAMASIDFGPKMDEAVRKFQRSKKLKDDGIVGPLTWGALGLSVDMNKPVTLASQPSNNTCYAAAATMVLGPAASVSFEPGPPPPGAAADDHWARSFASLFSWRLEYGMTPMPRALTPFLQNGPFWFAGNLPFPTGPSYHAVVDMGRWRVRQDHAPDLRSLAPRQRRGLREYFGRLPDELAHGFPLYPAQVRSTSPRIARPRREGAR
jgi:hypothetical protein